MRFRQRAPLGILLVLVSCLSVGSENAIGQSTQIDDAQSKLVQAFVLVRQADLEGASPGQTSLLANNLNLALGYEDNATRSEEHTSELQSRLHLVCRLLLEKKKKH